MTGFTALVVAVVTASTPAADYGWTRAREKYGWGHTAYVLNLVTFRDRLWAFEGNVIHSSPNGTDWTLETKQPGWRGEAAAGTALTFSGRLWTLGGHFDAGTRLRNDVWSSEDGKRWRQIAASAGWSPRRGHATVVFRRRMWVLGGDGFNDVWSSADGGHWTRVVEHAPWTARTRHQALVLNDRLWVIGGLEGQRELCDVWSSPDGASWVRITGCAEWGPRFVPSATVFDGKLWIVGGFQKSDAWYSEDGRQWRRAAERAGWFPRGGSRLAVLDDKLWLLGGKTGISSNSNPQDIWYMESAVHRASGPVAEFTTSLAPFGSTLRVGRRTLRDTMKEGLCEWSRPWR